MEYSESRTSKLLHRYTFLVINLICCFSFFIHSHCFPLGNTAKIYSFFFLFMTKARRKNRIYTRYIAYLVSSETRSGGLNCAHGQNAKSSPYCTTLTPCLPVCVLIESGGRMPAFLPLVSIRHRFFLHDTAGEKRRSIKILL